MRLEAELTELVLREAVWWIDVLHGRSVQLPVVLGAPHYPAERKTWRLWEILQ